MQRGLLDPEKEDPFSLFVASTNIRYCFYHDTHKILGNTFGMCVLQVRPEFCECAWCLHYTTELDHCLTYRCYIAHPLCWISYSGSHGRL